MKTNIGPPFRHFNQSLSFSWQIMILQNVSVYTCGQKKCMFFTLIENVNNGRSLKTYDQLYCFLKSSFDSKLLMFLL